MSDGGITVDLGLGEVLPWLENQIRSLFGRDEATLQEKLLLKRLHEAAVEITRSVQCVGMHKPVPFDSIYQPTKLRVRSGLSIQASAAFGTQNVIAKSIAIDRSRSLVTSSVDAFLESPESAVVFAGPGWGKTTFLHHVFRRKSREASSYTALITLRRPTALDDLEALTHILTSDRQKNSKSLLLVDGYDEISTEDRKRVSEALLRFSGARAGRYVLTCREHYSVIGLNVSHVRIDSFDYQDKVRFVTAFLLAFESKLDGQTIVNELEDRQFSDFLSHPLLLALACIVKSGKNSAQPRSAIRLLQKALETLQYAWDMEKGIDRERLTDLDGADRMQILKRIAWISRSPILDSTRAEGIVRAALDKMQFSRIDPIRVLQETSQFYGILVPSTDGWEFVHRTIQDYLAAKYWVESGQFANERTYDWDTRTAYAACISGDATRVLKRALESADGSTCAIEMLMNAPEFKMKEVAVAVFDYYSKNDRVRLTKAVKDISVAGIIETNLFHFMTARFLNHLIESCCEYRSDYRDILMGYCILELRRRLMRLDHSTYKIIESSFSNLRFQFRLNEEFVTVEMAKPA